MTPGQVVSVAVALTHKRARNIAKLLPAPVCISTAHSRRSSTVQAIMPPKAIIYRLRMSIPPIRISIILPSHLSSSYKQREPALAERCDGLWVLAGPLAVG